MKPISLGSLVFEVTEGCNYNCLYCYNIWNNPAIQPTRAKKPISSYPQMLRVLKRVFKTTTCSKITITGGEPTLAHRLEEIVLYCRLKGKTVNLISNGSADPKNYLQLYELGVSLFELPLHSVDPKIHDAMTTQAGSHASSLRSIKALAKKTATVIPVMILCAMNISTIAETFDLYKDLGIHWVMVNLFNPGGNGLRNGNQLVLPETKLQEAWTTINQAAERNRISVHSGVCLPPCRMDLGQFPRVSFVHCQRQLETSPITVGINGDLRMCNHSPTVVGNIFSDEPHNWFLPENLPNWMKERTEECHGCDLSSDCLGHCGAAVEQMNLVLGSNQKV